MLALWRILSLMIGKFYLSCLLASVVYTAYFLSRVLALLHSLQERSVPVEAQLRKASLLGITRSIESVRQLNLLCFLFGVTLANEVFATLRAIRESAGLCPLRESTYSNPELHSPSLCSEYSPSCTYFNGSLPPDWSQACWRNGENEPQGLKPVPG